MRKEGAGTSQKRGRGPQAREQVTLKKKEVLPSSLAHHSSPSLLSTLTLTLSCDITNQAATQDNTRSGPCWCGINSVGSWSVQGNEARLDVCSATHQTDFVP